MDQHIKSITGGYGVEDLVIRTVVPTGKYDKDNKPIKSTKWELKYPSTIVPQCTIVPQPMEHLPEEGEEEGEFADYNINSADYNINSADLEDVKIPNENPKWVDEENKNKNELC